MVKQKEIQRNKRRDIGLLAAMLAIVLLVNFVASFWFKRFDLTSEKRYTLAASTKKLLSEIDDEVLFKVYFQGDFNPGFTRLKNEAKEMLDEFRAYNENIQYEFINPYEEDLTPEEKSSIERQLNEKGLIPDQVIDPQGGKTSSTRIWPGAIVSYQGREAVWQIFSRQLGYSDDEMINNSVEELEFSLTNTIRKLKRIRKPEVTFIDGHYELDTIHRYDFMRALSEYYNVNQTHINGKLNALDGSDAIVIAKPDTLFSDKDQFIIDQFIMRGGKVLWLIDPLNVNMDTLKQKGYTLSLGRPLGIEEMLFKYGVRLNLVLLQDMQCSAIPINIGFRQGQPSFKAFPWLYAPLVLPDIDHPIVKNLNVIKFEYVSSIDTITAKGIKKTILLKTSRNTKIQPAPVRIALAAATLPVKESQFKDRAQPIACLLEGEFSSFVEHRRLPSVLQDTSVFKYATKSKPNKMIVVADGDIAANDYHMRSGSIYPLGYDKYTRQTFGNKTFLLNCMNYLLDDEGMLQLRSREVKLRMLDKKKIKQQRAKWQTTNVLMPLVLIILLGLVQFYTRKKKYAA